MGKNAELAMMAMSAADPERAAMAQAEFAAQYEMLVASKGVVVAEAVACSVALAYIINIDFEGGAYLKSFLEK